MHYWNNLLLVYINFILLYWSNLLQFRVYFILPLLYWSNLLQFRAYFILPLLYWSRESMVCGLSFACASMEVPACESTFFWV